MRSSDNKRKTTTKTVDFSLSCTDQSIVEQGTGGVLPNCNDDYYSQNDSYDQYFDSIVGSSDVSHLEAQLDGSSSLVAQPGDYDGTNGVISKQPSGTVSYAGAQNLGKC
jgi:hypothetical protein